MLSAYDATAVRLLLWVRFHKPEVLVHLAFHAREEDGPFHVPGGRLRRRRHIDRIGQSRFGQIDALMPSERLPVKG
jgi:hypothetical protein